ncbi:MAG: hypothetical protein NVS4B13_06520 [Candidatus Elarobacter sp.]
MNTHSIIRSLAAAALIALPSVALAAPDQNTRNPGQYNNGCPGGQWVGGQWVNGQWVNAHCVNNGRWNNNGRGDWNNGRYHQHDNEDNDDQDDDNGQGDGEHGNWNTGHNGDWNNGRNGEWNSGRNGGWSNGNSSYSNGYGDRGGRLIGTVSSFSPYNLYLNNGLHVVLHNGTVINPTGTNLTPGQRVRVIGYRNGDGTFAANQIDVVGNPYGGYRYLR